MLALVASSYPPIYGAIDSFRRLIITPILVLSAIPGLDRAIMGKGRNIVKPLSFFSTRLLDGRPVVARKWWSHFIPGAKRPYAMQYYTLFHI